MAAMPHAAEAASNYRVLHYFANKPDGATSYAAGPVGPVSGCSAGFSFQQVDATDNQDYWDVTTTGQQYGGCGEDYPGVTGLTDAQLKLALPAGFDPTVWGQDPSINNGWPYLLANPPQ
jgi:hypothetical protein